MPRKVVHCIGQSVAAPVDIWRTLASFDVAWHPLIAWSSVETTKHGERVRRFAAIGDDGAMCERLTYISHSDYVMGYSLVSGIAGAKSYKARLKITAADTGSALTWHADIDAAQPRAKEIAAGTEAVFEAGIAALNKLVAPPEIEQPALEPSKTTDLMIEGTPSLALTITPEDLRSSKVLCLFLHGIGGNRSNWNDQLTALGSLVPMAALDLRGYGDSTLGFSQTQITDYYDDILTVMHKFGAEKLILCGLSYGSWIASSFALQHPDKIAGLVLCGGCTGMSEADPDEREAFRVSREVPLNAGQVPADFADAVVNVIAGPNASQTSRVALHASMAAIPQGTYRDALNCFCNPLSKFDFAATNFPVLLMTGEHDRLAPPAEIRKISHRFADAGAPFVNFEVIEGAGHVCNLEAPEAVNVHLTHFIEMLVPPAKPSSKVAKKSKKLERILTAALREFSKNGYSGASMAAIAKRAEVSKPTIYQYIGQKDDLFHAVLDQGRVTILAPFNEANDKELIQVLWNFSWTYADYVLHPDNLSIARLIIGEAERVPDIARQFHESGPARALAGIAAYLDAARSSGALTFDEPRVAAEHLWSLILSGPRNHALHFPSDLPSEADLLRSITDGLLTFLRAYSTQTDADLLALGAISTHRPKRRPL